MADNNFENQTNNNNVQAAVTAALDAEKKKKKKKKWIIIAVVAVVIILIAVIASGGSDDSSSEDSNASAVTSAVSAESEEKANDTVGDFKCVVKGAKLCKDLTGKDAVLITYEFTNNSDSAVSFDVALDARAYQDGVGLETAILDEDTDYLDVDIKPGVTKEVKKAYNLRDTSTEIEIEVSELISFSDDKIVTTVEIDK
ncbi:DUF5067 domain-containing protein [uncultured Eubacterium sp.]|uniref:DUF5067 domain-containing protein n=1 Tax=uncultured Eubacterium sp. TaxID=165185 RepID=UPI0025D893B4|nr:DUF5067 domain-containing protein [uncultured Eubacterium sp.]